MEKVSLKKLKEGLSSWLEKAARGDVLQITRYNHPYVLVMGTNDPSLHTGSRVGKTDITPALKKAPKKPSLDFLLEDRSE